MWVFLAQFDGYVERLRILHLDGREPRVVSIRELLSKRLVEMFGEDYSCEEEFTDDSIREALRMFAIEGEQYGLVEEIHSSPHAREADLERVIAEAAESNRHVIDGLYSGKLVMQW